MIIIANYWSTSYEETQAEFGELSRGMEKEQEEYDRLISWAEIYGVCPFETKKMFISQFVKSVRVYRDYELEIEFRQHRIIRLRHLSEKMRSDFVTFS